ncbi:hypothetical protein [Coraliomargarita akajimensis]|uniref:Uncharacterized protein n=1 Tax=Coraliomargarita akajimensis (strain DSM 45221 / IAM 15411 / JCM 23193 / KCTC 12865 / 04OKA010-24) TaxID=583355 RepID=D5EPJ6_CORAD|nr:hypothetical protein [Coraliomargarita akajimensis]ADE53733.1 conserved hypothetical protein [Coraliomargarita akajimensis DSM 45221]
MTELEKRTQAWVGDAVLALFAREWILKQADISADKRSEVFVQLTSNQFLSSLGEPTAMEAEIGELYSAQGLEAAYTHIEAKFIPVFRKQQANRRKQGGSYRDTKGKHS